MLYLGTDAIADTARLADDPNKRCDPKPIGLWSSTSDVDSFLSRFNHDNNYTDGDIKLSLGDEIIIYDGSYYYWKIAGFDVENDRAASDGTVYDNGYGIMLYPRFVYDSLCNYWNSDNTTSGGYMNSLAHSTTNTFATNMKNNILGIHLVNRNVLLSSSVDSGGIVNGYTWTTAYGTIPTVTQLNGVFYRRTNIYDNGEANYIIPIFKYIDYYMSYNMWTRNIWGKENSDYKAYQIPANTNDLGAETVNYTSKYFHPLLYIR